MPKMADTSEDHRHLALVGSGDHFFIANRSARLNGAGRAGVSGRDESIRKREKGITGDGAAFEGEPGCFRFPNRNPRCINPRHLPGANTERAISAGINDRIGFNMLYHPPSE